jgi:hypothetical protein
MSLPGGTAFTGSGSALHWASVFGAVDWSVGAATTSTTSSRSWFPAQPAVGDAPSVAPVPPGGADSSAVGRSSQGWDGCPLCIEIGVLAG